MTRLRSPRTFSMPFFGLASLALALIFMSPQTVVAQATVLSASVSGYTATGLDATIPQSQWVPISVTRNDGATHMEASGQGGTFFTGCTIPCPYPPSVTQAFAGGFASADPGVVRVFASDLAVALPELNAPNDPVTENTHTVYANINAAAGFKTFLTVKSATLPVGTPVQIPFHYGLQFTAYTDLGYPPYSAHPLSAGVQFTITGIGDQNFSTDNCHIGFCGFTTTTLGNTIFYSLRSIEIPVTANVGDVITISATLGISGTARIVNGNIVSGDGSVIRNWADARDTAGIWLGTLPNGITVTSSDGHDYTIDPTQGEVPVAPAQVAATATAGDALAIVSFAAPVGTGASAITDFTVTSSPGGITASGPGSPIAVRGLTNGTAYTFTVTSKNAAGMTTDSAPTNSVTPDASLAPSPASAPVIGVATAGDGQASVAFTAPAIDGGSAITGYTVTSSPGGITATGAASPITVTGLANGTAYTFTVTASNANGTSAASAASNSVTPQAPTAASAPVIGIATAGDGQASVAFAAPAMDGGSAITGYTVTSTPGGITATGTASPITVTGLTNGTAYTFAITASNAIGTSPVSETSNSVTPTATASPTPSPATNSGGGGSTSILLLVGMSAILGRRLRCAKWSTSSEESHI
jgi:hypothetical protein